jgi:hypothetical protein
METIAFKTIDAATGQPLAGVSTVWRMDSYTFLGNSTFHYGQTNVPPSGEDGVIVIDGIYKSKTSKFIFSRTGYATVYGIYLDGSLDRAEHINTNDNRYPFTEQNFGFMVSAPVSHVWPTNGVYVIRMIQQ